MTGKGTIRFAYDERLPVGLVKKIVQDAGWPERRGAVQRR